MKYLKLATLFFHKHLNIYNMQNWENDKSLVNWYQRNFKHLGYKVTLLILKKISKKPKSCHAQILPNQPL